MKIDAANMIENCYKFAGIAVQICTNYSVVQNMCKDYRTEDAPEFAVMVLRSDLSLEREAVIRTGEVDKAAAMDMSEAVLEVTAVYRKIAEKMIDYDTLLFHGSCIAIDNEGYLFTAPSGTGKSTHTRLLRNLLGERAFMVNDDKPLLTIQRDGVTAHGTPWDGKHHLNTNCSVPLKGIILLSRAEENSMEKLTTAEAWPVLIQQSYHPENRSRMPRVLELLDRVIQNVDLYHLYCNMEPKAADLSYRTVKGLL